MITGGILNNWSQSGQNSTAAVSTDVLYAAPIYLPDTCRIARMFAEVTGASAGNLRMSIYTDSGGYPNTLLLTETEITTMGTTGIKQQSIGLTLPYGFYWVASVYSSTPTMRADPVGAGQVMHWLGGTSATDTAPHTGISVAHTYGALPSTFTGGGTLVVGAIPRMLLGVGKGVTLQ
jgi:hypothetical protein